MSPPANDDDAPADPGAALRRAQEAMRTGRYDEAIAAADVAITALLHDGLDVASFVRLSLRGAQAEGLMRVERGAVARLRRLHEPIAIRWEALRRSGRSAEARQMRALCIRHFPERASVWAAAGNQALDENELRRADAYFERCLALSPNWTAGLAGKAIVFERRKDWQRALEYRERVVRVEGALERADAPSLQRVIRYAAALGRAGRWLEAGVLFRRCVALGAFEQLPAEQPVLLRVFSRELYAPALIAVLAQQAPAALADAAPEVTAALREAALLGAAYARLQAGSAEPLGERLLLLGMCAWLAGDAARAYALLDEAEVYREGDLITQHLLACSAATLLAPELPSIVRFATDAARAALQRAERGESLGAEAHVYALATLARFRTEQDVPEAAAESIERISTASAACAAEPASDSLPDQIRRLAAQHAAQRAAGRSALEAALASTDALTHLERTLAATMGPWS